MGLDGSMLQLNFDGKNSTDQNEQIHTVTSAASKLFFVWKTEDKPCPEVIEELDVFVKTHDKVTEKSPDKLVGGNLSIHSSIYSSIHLSINQLINFLYMWCRWQQGG